MKLPLGTSPLLLCLFATVPTVAAPQEKTAYFGDLHIHTQSSADAFLFNSRATADDAYAYAKGESILHPAGFRIRLVSGPLDFAAVTDHGEMLGVLNAMTDPRHPSSQSDLARRLGSDERATMVAAYYELMADVATRGVASPYRDRNVIRSAWKANIDAAERHNDPGHFTTFVGYEYSSAPANQNIHRNVLFASGRVPQAPFTSVQSTNPEDLWAWLDRQREQGMDGFAIPHNSNVSNGLMFQSVRFSGEPIDASYASLRARNEPLVEVSQGKGTSETHPDLSPDDEWAGFELYDNLIASADVASKSGGFVREAYRTGIELQTRIGFNPFAFGLIGSSDTHNGGGSVEEQYYTGHVGTLDATPEARGSVPSTTRDARFGSDDAVHAFSQWSAAGLAGVWALENTRQALFDAMRRRETFATSGPRIRVQFAAGDSCEQFSDEDSHARGVQPAAVVPMGGQLRGRRDSAPCFHVWASRDPDSAPLERLQIVKGWVDGEKSHERVIDVACANGFVPDERTHRCADNGARVDLADCSSSPDRGAAQLRVQWRDADFQPHQTAFYYVRVLEIPTCRWSTWDALRAGVKPNSELPATIRERAWSSPIWYLPRNPTAGVSP